MKNFRIKCFISILLCFVMITGLTATVRVRAEEDKKVEALEAEYVGEKDGAGNALAGTKIDFRTMNLKLKYEGETDFVPIPENEKPYIKFSKGFVPYDGSNGFDFTITYEKTGNKKTIHKFINKTDEIFDRLVASWSGATNYYVGDEIKKGEITVIEYYWKLILKDGTPQREAKNRIIGHNLFQITPTAIKADGVNNITVEYPYLKKTTIVQIKGYGEKELEVTYAGDKNIVVGNSVDQKKIKASIVYSNNDKKAVNNKELVFENLEVKAAGPHDVIVKYGNLTGKLSVNGIAKTAEKISAKYTGVDLVVGTKIDPSKITVEITNNDKTKERITSGFTISPETVTKVGANTITVTYKGYSDTVVIKGTEILPTSITATYNGGTVIEGQTINKSSILVTAYYPDGTNKTVSDFDLSIETMNKVGMQDVVVKYKNLTATIYVPVTAKMVTQLEAVYNGGALEQFESLDRKKLIVTATYNDGSRTNVDDYTLTTTTASKVGENLFMVTFGAKTATFTVEALARRITGMGSLKAEVGSGDYSSTLTAFIQDQVVREGIKLETEEIEEDVIKSAIKRVNNGSTKKYIAFEMDIDSFQFDENQYLTAEITVPDGFDPAKVAVYFTPDRKKTMIQQTGGLVANNLYRFYAYSSGSYVIMENNNNDITLQEMRDNEQRKPFMVVSIDRRLPVKTKSKIKPYVLFSAYKNEEYTYEVDNEDLMTVSKEGEMVTKAAGTATVTVTAKNSGLSESYEIKIKDPSK